jgi:uncharacterized protein (PEP-CTERM system associated)
MSARPRGGGRRSTSDRPRRGGFKTPHVGSIGAGVFAVLTGVPVLAQVGTFPPGEPVQQQPAPSTGLPSPSGLPSQIGLPSPLGLPSPSELPSQIGLPSSPGGAAASPESPFGLSPDIFPGLLGGRPDRQIQQPPAQPGVSRAPTGARPETATPAEPGAPLEPQPGLATTPDLAPPAFLNPGFGFGSLPGYGFDNLTPGLTPGGALLTPNPGVPFAAENPLATAMLAPLTPGALPVQIYDLRAPPVLIQPSISAFAGFTDNARSIPSGSPDGFGRLLGSTAISVDTVRLQGQFSGALNYQKFLHNSDQDRLDANLLAYGLGTVVRDHLFVDARAVITQASQTGGLGFAGPGLIRQSDQTQVITTSLTPIARQSFGGYVDGELRYNYATVMFQQGSLLGNSSTPGTAPSSTNLNNATQNEATINLATGRLFTIFSSRLTLDAQQVDSQSAARSKQLRATDNLAYQFNEKFTGLASFGYENLRYPLQPAANFTGPSWSVGAQYTPSPRGYLLVNYGRQEGLPGFSGSARYEITAQTVALASYSRSRTSQQGQILNNLNTSVVNPSGNLVNQFTGLPTALVNPELALSTAVFRYDTATAGLQTQLDRNSLSLLGFYARRSPLGTPVGTAALASTAGQDTSLGVNFTWGRSLTPYLSSSAALGYATQTASDQRTLTATLNMTYLLGERLNATLLYQFIDVDSAVANGSYRRNQVEIGLTRSF